MALQQIAGTGLYTDWLHRILMKPVLGNAVIDATGEKIAMVGRVWRPDGAGGDITKVHFLFGTVVKAGGSGLTVSLQDTSLTAGAPMQPDGTQDQTVAISNGDAGFASDTWYTTAALSANRTVAFGDRLSVVIEYDGSGRLGSDSVQIAGMTSSETVPLLDCGYVLFTSSWSLQSRIPNVILEFSDGAFGTLSGAVVTSSLGDVTFNSGSSPDEYALRFVPVFSGKVDGGWMIMATNSAPFDIVLYEGTSALTNGTISGDSDALGFEGTIVRTLNFQFPGLVELTAGTTYYLSLKPTSGSSVKLQYIDVAANEHLAAHGFGPAAYLATREDAGAWSTTTTRRPLCALRYCALGDGAGGGAAGRRNMRGNFIN